MRKGFKVALESILLDQLGDKTVSQHSYSFLQLMLPMGHVLSTASTAGAHETCPDSGARRSMTYSLGDLEQVHEFLHAKCSCCVKRDLFIKLITQGRCADLGRVIHITY